MKKAKEYFNGIDLNVIKPMAIVDAFVKEQGLTKINYCTSESIWSDFCDFCGGMSPMTKQSFHKLLTNNYPVKSKTVSIDNRVRRILIVEE
ncbi:MAG: hypothetical protein MJZ52_07165 [Bacteroidales bacterium]|nr:hypothetical protein [Bacteroidales bacterium]